MSPPEHRPDRRRVAVVGAGPAGLMAARSIADHGHSVAVFDKGRGVGGRTSTRRVDEFAFDHGAQYLTSRDPRLRRHLDSWIEKGVLAPWRGRILAREDDRLVPKMDTTRYVGLPGMSALARHLAHDLDVVTDARVLEITRDDTGWALSFEDRSRRADYDVVLVTAPAPQSATLLQAVPELCERASAVGMVPCWALMLGFDHQIDVEFDGLFANDARVSWIARNSSKPGRPSTEAWVVHADPHWSQRHLQDDPAQIQERLSDCFFELIEAARKQPRLSRVHRWRFSQPTSAVEGDCLWDAALGIGAGGDWCQENGRVEGALLSGMALAQRVLSLTNPPFPARP